MTHSVLDRHHPSVWPQGLSAGFIVLLSIALWWLMLWAAIGIFG